MSLDQLLKIKKTKISVAKSFYTIKSEVIRSTLFYQICIISYATHKGF